MRGATIAGMIVVNNPGTWSAVYPQLRHAEWHGWTYTDTIFPFFLFLVGVSMALSFGERRATGASRRMLARKTALRAAILVALGLALNLVGFLALHREHYRIPGVLQRIGLCVLAAGLIYLAGGVRGAAWGAVGLLLVYGDPRRRGAARSARQSPGDSSTARCSGPTRGTGHSIRRGCSRRSRRSPRRFSEPSPASGCAGRLPCSARSPSSPWPVPRRPGSAWSRRE